MRPPRAATRCAEHGKCKDCGPTAQTLVANTCGYIGADTHTLLDQSGALGCADPKFRGRIPVGLRVRSHLAHVRWAVPVATLVETWLVLQQC